MSSHHLNPRALLNAATRSLIDRVMRAGRPPMATMTALQARAFYDIGGPMLDLQPPPHVDRVEDLQIPTRDGHGMPTRLYAPQPKPHPQPHKPSPTAHLPVLLYLHGGGFTVGSLTTHDVLCRQLSRLGQCAVVSLDYRLAPEHRFPTAVHDAWDALQWLHQHGGHLLTAGKAWTGLATPRGATLAVMAGLWLAARLSAVGSPYAVYAVLDVVLLPWVAFVLIRVLLKAGNRRNLPLGAILLLLATANLSFHAAVLGWLDIDPLRALHAGWRWS